MFAFLVAARFADPIVSLSPYQFARDRKEKLAEWTVQSNMMSVVTMLKHNPLKPRGQNGKRIDKIPL